MGSGGQNSSYTNQTGGNGYNPAMSSGSGSSSGYQNNSYNQNSYSTPYSSMFSGAANNYGNPFAQMLPMFAGMGGYSNPFLNAANQTQAQQATAAPASTVSSGSGASTGTNPTQINTTAGLPAAGQKIASPSTSPLQAATSPSTIPSSLNVNVPSSVLGQSGLPNTIQSNSGFMGNYIANQKGYAQGQPVNINGTTYNWNTANNEYVKSGYDSSYFG